MQKPNFFVLGAPKCGTTTICSWLAAHDQVFFSPQKEPHFFNTDSKQRGTFTLDRYEQYFASADSRHKAVGEGSVWYLASTAAVSNILEYSPAARFIVCLRNPIEAAVSMHNQSLYTGDETIVNFRDAWQAQWDRESGKEKIPASCLEVTRLLYGKACLFGQQVSKLFDAVDTQRVLIITLDEIKAD
ncbi:MAG: sulfotransferase, partial [Pseudomonadota bacterium]